MNQTAELLPAETNSTPPATVRAQAEAERARAEIQAAVVLAHKNPRDEARVFEKVLNMMQRQSMAERASYKKPRGNSSITGPSVHLARAVARCWGNIESGFRVTDEDHEYVSMSAHAHDLESNSRVVLEDRFKKSVPRKIKGETHWVEPTEEALRELKNRRGAYLERNCLLKLLPPDLIDDAMEVASDTLLKIAAGQKKQSRDETVKALIQNFAKHGVSVFQLEDYMGHSVAKITDEEVACMREIYFSLKSGEAIPPEIFASEEEIKEKMSAVAAAKDKGDQGKETLNE
jgi:hypothetical protein